MREELTQARAWIRAGEAVALARVTEVIGSAPRPIGSAMVIGASGQFLGSVSGGCVEGSVIQSAEEVLRTGQATTLRFSGDADPLTEIVLGCGGSEAVFVERIDQGGDLSPVFAALLDQCSIDDTVTLLTVLQSEPAHWLLDESGAVIAADVVRDPDLAAGGSGAAFAHDFQAPIRLVIVGADAVGQAVAQLGQFLGWPVTVVDPRAAWLSPLRFPLATRIVRWPDEALPELPLDSRTALVVLSHDPKIDEPALQVALRSGAGYIGALGSRRAHIDRMQRLRDAGLSDQELARLHAPVGLDLGGREPAEMALSVIAEIVASRHGRHGGQLKAATGPIHGLVAANATA